MGCLNRKKGKVLIGRMADQYELYTKCLRYNKQLLTPPGNGSSIQNGIDQRKDSIKIIKVLGGDLEAKSIWGNLTGYNLKKPN